MTSSKEPNSDAVSLRVTEHWCVPQISDLPLGDKLKALCVVYERIFDKRKQVSSRDLQVATAPKELCAGEGPA